MASHGASGGQAQRALFTPAGAGPAQRRAEKRLGETPDALPPGLRRKGEAAAGTGSRARSRIAVVRSVCQLSHPTSHCTLVPLLFLCACAFALLFAGAWAHSSVPPPPLPPTNHTRPLPMLPGCTSPWALPLVGLFVTAPTMLSVRHSARRQPLRWR